MAWRADSREQAPFPSFSVLLPGPKGGGRGTIIISTATVLVCFGYVQRVDVGMYISLMAIGLETAVGYEDTAAATARYSLPAYNPKGGDSSV